MFWTVVLEKTLESFLDDKIKPGHLKGNQSWIFIGKTDAEAETPILWPHNVKSWLIWKDPGARRDWRQEEKGMTGNEMVGWCHRLDGHEFEQAAGVGDGQGSLMCCSPWGLKVSDMSEWLNWTELRYIWYITSASGFYWHPVRRGRGRSKLSYNARGSHLDHCCSVTKSHPTLQPHELQHARLPCPWDSPGSNTGMGCHFLLQGIFPTQGLNQHLLCLLHCRQILYH